MKNARKEHLKEKKNLSKTFKLMYDSSDEENDEEKDQNHKVLTTGDFFGEVSLIYDCKRSSTVIGNTYGTYGKLDEDTVLDLFAKHPEFTQYLKDRILKTYDDDLKVFLMRAFEHIDYLRNLPEEILAHLAFCMEAEKLEANEHVFEQDENYEKFVIIFDGIVELYTDMDKDTEFPIEKLTYGSVINAHQFLIDRKTVVSARCLKNSIIYTMSAEKFFKIADEYPKLAKIRNE